MKTATIQYKCRRCDALFDSVSANKQTIKTALSKAVLDNVFEQGHSNGTPAMLTIHSCNDGGEGVADLVGFRED
jgi:hypothetical protein